MASSRASASRSFQPFASYPRAAHALILTGALLGACAATLPERGPETSGWVGGTDLAKGADAGAEPDCRYGRLEDPHRGFIRCLEPGEADAGWLPPATQPEAPPDAGAPDSGKAPASGADGGQEEPGKRAESGAPSDAGTPAPEGPPSAESDAGTAAADAGAEEPPAVEVGEPSFENGDVPRLGKALGKARKAMGQCIAEHGGLRGTEGSMKVQFLVRARGRAEGVEIEGAKGVSDEAVECVRLELKNKAVGAPSADPVGVNLTLTFRRAKEPSKKRRAK